MPIVDPGLSQTSGLLVALVLGVAFGWFLERGGLGNARKLSGQFYGTDFTVLKVMFSAIVTAMLGLFWLSQLGLVDATKVFVPATFVWPQLVGGLVFGLGFVWGGLCPGTSCVAASSGRIDGIVLLLGMFAGVIAFNEAFPWLESFYETGSLGQRTIPDVLGVSDGVIVFVVVVLAVVLFNGATFAERIMRK